MTSDLDEESMVADLRRLVEVESPSTDLSALHRCADELVEIAQRVTKLPVERLLLEGRPILHIGAATPRVLLLGHLDTVHPIGTLARNPWTAGRDRITGPGVLDMKAGLIIGLYALARSRDAALLITSDEELGSPHSASTIIDRAVGSRAVLVLESSRIDALKIARKGVARYVLEFTGRAAHAGLEPEKGANALVAMAEFVKMVETNGSELG